MNNLITNFKKISIFFITILTSSLAYYFSTGFNNIWGLLWLAPIPILLYTLNTSILISITAGFITYFLGSLSYLPYLSSGMPFNYIFLSPTLISGSAFILSLIIFRLVVLNTKYYWLGNFAFALFWTLFELIRSLFSIDGTLGNLAYTQLTNLPIAQIASLTGIWGITFLLTLVPASIALAIHYRKEDKKIFKIIIIPIALLLFAITYGIYRLSTPASNDLTLKIGIVGIKTTNKEIFSLNNKDKLNILRKYTVGIKKLAKNNVDVILLPEEIMTLTPKDENFFLQKFAVLAKENKVNILFGIRLLTNNSKQFYNSAYLFSSDGKLLIRYDKQHPLLLYESDMIRGNTLGILNMQNKGKIGIAICKDNDFINPNRAYGKEKIDLLLVPAFDFEIDAWLHARPAIMQGIAGNYAVARAAQKGLLSLTDSRGRIIALKPIAADQEQTVLIGEVK